MAPTQCERSADASHSSPASTQGSHESSTNSSFTSAFPRERFVSEQKASNLVKLIEENLKAVTPPQSAVDFTKYARDIGRILSDDAGLLFMLEPLSDDNTPLEHDIADFAIKLFRTRVPYDLRDDLPLTQDVSRFLSELRAHTPSFHLRDVVVMNTRPSWRTPERQRNETLRQFLTRFDAWRDRHGVEDLQPLVHYFARTIYATHAQLYDVSNVETSFEEERPNFTSFSEVYRWFRSKPVFNTLPSPLPATGRSSSRGSSAQRSKQASHTNSKGQGSSQKSNGSSANSASPSQQNHGNVNKNGNAKTAAFNKRSRSKKHTSPRSTSNQPTRALSPEVPLQTHLNSYARGEFY